MPNGFVGPPPASYLPEVENALRKAAAVHSAEPFFYLRNWTVPPPQPPPRPNVEPPHPASTAMSGSYVTGAGSFRNIVVGLDEYYDIFKKINQADDKISEELYYIAEEVHKICSVDFVVPMAVPECLRISTDVKKSLEDFRALTDTSIDKMRRFKDEIMSVK